MDKIPYGTKYSFDNLPFIFPNADIRTSRIFPDLSRNENAEDTVKVLIIVGPEFTPEPDEMRALIHFAASGRNQVFISAMNFGDTVMSMLNLYCKRGFVWRRRQCGYQPAGSHKKGLGKIFLSWLFQSIFLHKPGHRIYNDPGKGHHGQAKFCPDFLCKWRIHLYSSGSICLQ